MDASLEELHPVVAAFIRYGPESLGFLEAIQRESLVHDRKVKAIIALHETTLNLGQMDNAIALAEDAYADKSDVNLQIIFLQSWARLLLFRQNQWEQYAALLESIELLIGLKTHPVLKSITLYLRSTHAFIFGRLSEADRLIKQAIHLLEDSNAHKHTMLIEFVSEIGCLLQGHGHSLSKHQPGYRNEIGEVHQYAWSLASYVNASIVGDLNTLRAVRISRKNWDLGYLSFMRTDYEVAQYVRELLEISIDSNYSIINLASQTDEPYWLLSSKALLKGDIETSLEYARAHVAEPKKGRRTVVGFDEYCLIRSELAAGNVDAAQFLINKRYESGTHHFIDSFFMGRIALRKKQSENAAIHFTNLQKELRNFHAFGRLELELKMSPELTAMELLSSFSSLEDSKYTHGSNSVSQSKTVDLPFQLAETKSANQGARVKGIEKIIHSSEQMTEVCHLIKQFAPQNMIVLITGETGTGKELVARALHDESDRSKHPFLAINCSAISDALIESELFGHARGSFTGAHAAREGLFVQAGAGTLFLDEIGDISPRLQSALLRVLEQRKARPVGGQKEIPFNCRIVAATNKSLEKQVSLKLFRSDLMFRLKRLEILLPPLRERPADIPDLVKFFFNQRRLSAGQVSVSPQLLDVLMKEPWDGNIRELENVIERMRILHSDKLFYSIDDYTLITRKPIPVSSPADYNASNSINTKETRQNRVRANQDSPSESINYEDIDSILKRERTSLRCVDHLRELFNKYRKFKTHEIAKILEVSRPTASRYAKQLAEEGFIEKVAPTKSRSSHYYKLK